MRKRLNTIFFIKKAKDIHGNKYDYSLIKYNHSQIKVKIICPEHGEFEQTPNRHLLGCGCKFCGIEEARKQKFLTNFSFIKKAKDIHGNKYDYSKVSYLNSKRKVIIICPEHGEFEQTPSMHLNGQGCPKCAYVIKSNEYTKKTDVFIKESVVIHNNKYDYSKVSYLNSKRKVIIICPEHGEFEQTPSMHLNGQGCPICRESKGEKIIRNILMERGITFEYQKTFEDCRGKKNKLPFDFYLCNNNTLIEFDGIQHYKPINTFGGVGAFNLLKKTDKIKNNYCERKKIKLIRIKYNNINKIEKILENEKIF